MATLGKRMKQAREQEYNTCQERLAEYAHEAWAGWMRYMFDKSLRLQDGGILITPPNAERWTRQMNTPYAELPESEKASDLVEADIMLAIISEVTGILVKKPAKESE